MDQNSFCPKCAGQLLPGGNFCPTCGLAVPSSSVTISIGRQIWIYAVSICFPPFGLLWTYKYFRVGSSQQKKVAIAAAVLTMLSLIFSLWFAIGFFQTIQSQVSSYSNLGL